MPRSNRRVSTLVLPLLLIACDRPSDLGSALTVADRAAIDSVFASVVNSIRTSDWDAFASTFAEDAVFHPANSPALHGRDAIKAWAGTGPKATSAFDFTNVEIIGEGNLAYATSDVAMNFEGVPPDKAKQLVVLRKEPSGEWKTVAVSFNSDTPMPMPTTTPQ
jgi:uncharacterized protein (TIGR02246 family)